MLGPGAGPWFRFLARMLVLGSWFLVPIWALVALEEQECKDLLFSFVQMENHPSFCCLHPGSFPPWG